MLIDTEKLRELIGVEFYKQGERADRIKNDNAAIKALTRIETNELKALRILADIESLAKEFNYEGEITKEV